MLGMMLFVIGGFSLLVWNSYRTARARAASFDTAELGGSTGSESA